MMTREEFVDVWMAASACTEKSSKFVRTMNALLDHDAEQRQAIDQQAKTIRTFREALDWSGLKVTTNDILSSLQELGPTGTREEASDARNAVLALYDEQHQLIGQQAEEITNRAITIRTLREALQQALSALKRGKPQILGVLVVQDFTSAIEEAQRVLEETKL